MEQDCFDLVLDFDTVPESQMGLHWLLIKSIPQGHLPPSSHALSSWCSSARTSRPDGASLLGLWLLRVGFCGFLLLFLLCVFIYLKGRVGETESFCQMSTSKGHSQGTPLWSPA